MAATLAASAQLAADPAFLAAVTAAVQQQAVLIGQDVLAMESPSALDKQRLILAQNALSDSAAYGARFVSALASDPAVDSTIDDATILAKVSALWNLVAGATV